MLIVIGGGIGRYRALNRRGTATVLRCRRGFPLRSICRNLTRTSIMPFRVSTQDITIPVLALLIAPIAFAQFRVVL